MTKRAHVNRLLAFRARLVLACADAPTDTVVARRYRTTNTTVGKWRTPFIERRLEGLLDEPRVGGPRTISDADVEAVVKTLETTPKGETHWSTRTMSHGGLQFLGIATKSVHGFREFTRKHRQVVALFDQDGDVAPKFLARSSHPTTSIRLAKSPMISLFSGRASRAQLPIRWDDAYVVRSAHSAFRAPFDGSHRELPQVFRCEGAILGEPCRSHHASLVPV